MSAGAKKSDAPCLKIDDERLKFTYKNYMNRNAPATDRPQAG
jgi:hypothetical protein